jgi:hypothetical protein
VGYALYINDEYTAIKYTNTYHSFSLLQTPGLIEIKQEYYQSNEFIGTTHSDSCPIAQS